MRTPLTIPETMNEAHHLDKHPTTASQPSDRTHVCPAWLEWLLDNPVRRRLHNPHAILGGLVKPGQRVADVGAGSGYFSLPLAELVGETGKVYAVDLQPAMLRRIERKAARRQLPNLVTCQSDEHGFTLPERVDFVLVFWMLHEVPATAGFLAAIRAALNDGGTVLFAEPKFHVTQAAFQRETACITPAGFRIRGTVSIRASRSLLLEKA